MHEGCRKAFARLAAHGNQLQPAIMQPFRSPSAACFATSSETSDMNDIYRWSVPNLHACFERVLHARQPARLYGDCAGGREAPGSAHDGFEPQNASILLPEAAEHALSYRSRQENSFVKSLALLKDECIEAPGPSRIFLP
jgi:hypothetical protein